MSTPTWLTVAQIPVPNINDFPTTADFMLAYGIHSALSNPNLNFLSSTPDAELASPKAYLDAMTAYAQSLLANKFPIPYAPVGWDPVAAARTACIAGFKLLEQLPVNASDSETVSVYMAWTTGTGAFYGGHVPAPAAPASGSTNPSTASGPGQAGTIFEG